MLQIAARFFDGESARQIDATAYFNDENVVVRDGAGNVLAVWPADEVRLVGKPGLDQPLRMARGRGDARIVINEPSYLFTLEQLYPDLHKLRPGFREVWRPIAMWGTVAVASLAFIFWVGSLAEGRSAKPTVAPPTLTPAPQSAGGD